MFGNVICRVCLPWGLREGECCREFCSQLLVVCPRPRNSSRNFGEACSGGRQLPPIFWQRISRGGRELFGRGLAEGGGSYRQFWERRALREGSHRRFFGREFAEGRGQLSPIFGEACPGGRQLSPIFWRRICRACRLRRQARKGEQSMEDYRKTIQKGTKKDPKWYPGGT